MSRFSSTQDVRRSRVPKSSPLDTPRPISKAPTRGKPRSSIIRPKRAVTRAIAKPEGSTIPRPTVRPAMSPVGSQREVRKRTGTSRAIPRNR